MPILADDDVVVHFDAQRLGHLDDGARHLDVGVGGRRVATRVVVDQPMKLKNLIYLNMLFRTEGEVVPVSGVCNSRKFVPIPV